MEMIKIEDYKNCPECNKKADKRMLRIYSKRYNKSIYNEMEQYISFGHCMNPDCSITYFLVKN